MRFGSSHIHLQQALIDSGAVNNFINVEVACALHIPLQPKGTSDLVETFDESLLSSDLVTHKTAPLEIDI